MGNIKGTKRNKKISRYNLHKKRNNTSRKQANITHKNKGRSKRGGEAIASGGFGCIFKPALKCKGKSYRTNGISKMSLTKFGQHEMMEIEGIRKKLKKVKSYQKYYLLDVDMCKPDKLTKEDMKNFDKKCYALTRHNINEKNVNNTLDKLTVLNMPDAGIDLMDWLIINNKITKKKIVLLNEIVIKLIQHGVRPMNDAGVIHNDLKDTNILIDRNLDARIIDWGLSGVVSSNRIPPEIMDRPLQFNTPFSSRILSEDFKTNYNNFLQSVKNDVILFNRTNVRNYVINHYLIKNANSEKSVDDNISVFNMIFSRGISEDTFLSKDKKDSLVEYGYYMYYLSNYLTDILMKYTNSSMEFDMNRYFRECYLYNSDIFGLMTVYYNFFGVKIEDIELPDKIKNVYLNRIRSLLVEHLYSNGGEKINIKTLVDNIKELNDFLKADNVFSLSALPSTKRNYSINNDINLSPITVTNVGSNSSSYDE